MLLSLFLNLLLTAAVFLKIPSTLKVLAQVVRLWYYIQVARKIHNNANCYFFDNRRMLTSYIVFWAKVVVFFVLSEALSLCYINLSVA